MSGLYQDDFVEELRQGLAGMVDQWGLDPASDIRLLNLSENATFLVTAPSGGKTVFRVHRPGYHSVDEIGSELAWVDALRQASVVDTPAILSRRDGALIGEFSHHGQPRHVVGFDFMTGCEPDPDGDLVEGFHSLGATSARLHHHALHWTPPASFHRKTWDWDAAFGPDALWGDWRDAPGLDGQGCALLSRLADRLRDRCASFGTGPDRFGLIHADLRLANLLVQGDRLGVIDFDDCGFSWFAYDFAAAISFIETSPTIPALFEAWVAGYRTVGPLSDAHLAMMPSFILFRRLLLTAWIASHGETETAAWAGHGAYTAGTLALAETYLMDETRILNAG